MPYLPVSYKYLKLLVWHGKCNAIGMAVKQKYQIPYITVGDKTYLGERGECHVQVWERIPDWHWDNGADPTVESGYIKNKGGKTK